MEEFGSISDELLLFFYINQDNYESTFMTTFYYHPYKDKLLDGSYNLSMLQNELLKYDEVIDNVLKFYFQNVSDEMLNQCKTSLTVANTLIRESGYDSCVKNALYSFLIDPVSTIQRLSYELMTKEFLLSKQYEKHYADLFSLQEKFDYATVSAGLKDCGAHSIDIDFASEIVISFSYNNKNHIRVVYNEDKVLLTLGVDYIDSIRFLSETKTAPNLHEFGTAISEKNRVAILQLIHDKKEISIKEVEQALNMAGTNAYYHLSLMIRTGMLKTRNQGRTVLYSINHNYFDMLSKAIGMYSQEKN